MRQCAILYSKDLLPRTFIAVDVLHRCYIDKYILISKLAPPCGQELNKTTGTAVFLREISPRNCNGGSKIVQIDVGYVRICIFYQYLAVDAIYQKWCRIRTECNVEC